MVFPLINPPIPQSIIKSKIGNIGFLPVVIIEKSTRRKFRLFALSDNKFYCYDSKGNIELIFLSSWSNYCIDLELEIKKELNKSRDKKCP